MNRKSDWQEKTYKIGKPIFKEYRLINHIGEGGFGRVWLVENTIGQRYALKVLFRDFEMEQRGVKAVKQLSSDRVVTVHDYGKTVHGEFCVLMEYIRDNLSGVVGKEKIEEAKAGRYFVEILKALNALEKYGLIHRDIKPSNLFVREGIIKVGDFGTVKFTAGDSSSKSTRVARTIHYTAPEAFGKKYDHSVDRWSACVILYRMLTGVFPFDGDYYQNIFGAIMREDPDWDILPDKYVLFLRKSFEKEPRKRYSNAEEMIRSFGTLGTEKQKIIIKENAPEQNQVSPSTKEQKGETTEEKDRAVVIPRSEPIVTKSEYEFGLTDAKNDFVDNKDGTITDRATGLMWEKKGADKFLNYKGAEAYAKKLGRNGFGGHQDWRLPTVDELWTLMEKTRRANWLHIDTVFDVIKTKYGYYWCWSADKYESESSGSAWYVDFHSRSLHWGPPYLSSHVRCVRRG